MLIEGDRCFVDYFELFLGPLRNTGVFYGRLLPPTNEEQIRLGQQVVGVKKLKSNVKTITQKNGLKGNVSIHSGKLTCANSCT